MDCNECKNYCKHHYDQSCCGGDFESSDCEFFEQVSCANEIIENTDQGCTLCRRYGLEKGDTLYQVAYPDTGIDFYAIHDIKYCPLCGKELKEDNT